MSGTEILLDPNNLSEDGTSSLAGYQFSKDGNYMAYFVKDRGSDWVHARLRDTKKRTDTFIDKLNWIKFSNLSWTHDNLGFFYCRYDAPADKTEMDETTG